mgnify:CR=1 FL=1
MNRKVIIQILLLIVLFGIIISVFLTYFNKKENIRETNIITNETAESEINSETGTLIKDISYLFSDPAGNYYELFSKTGEVDITNSDKMFMTDVKANIYLTNSAPIIIVSKYANYNKANHETNFFENVKVTHLIHEAKSKNLDISFKKNIVSMYNNVVYDKPGTKLIADRLEIDLITKNTKILMDDKSEKIKIIDSK